MGKRIQTIQKELHDPAKNTYYRKELSFYTKSFILSPMLWKTLNKSFDKYKWDVVPFKLSSLSGLQDDEGLYFFAIAPNISGTFEHIRYLCYIGETKHLKTRFKQYLNKSHKPNSSQYEMYTLIDEFPDNLFFHFYKLPKSTEKERMKLEDQLLVAFAPPINNKYPAKIQKLVLATYKK